LFDPEARPPDDVLDGLAASPSLAFAEPQYVYRATRQVNDWGEYMWAQRNTGANGGRAGSDVAAFDAWDRSTGAGVVVAVIDTGIQADHPDLASQLWRNEDEVAGNGIDDDHNGYVDDTYGWDFVYDDNRPEDSEGHGTHTAGTIAARADDSYGVPGLAFDARVMPLRFLAGNAGGYTSMAVEAINYAVNNGAHVINASWGGYGESTAIRNAISYARSRGVLFVAAAGNEGNNNDQYGFFPASYPLDNIISVAASDRRDRVADWSNYGASQVDLAAPGVEIVSTVNNSDWAYMDGTSMAAPHVAAAAALLRSVRPNLSAAELRAALLQSVDPLQGGAARVATGGRLDARAALDLVLGGTPAEPEPSDGEGGGDGGGGDPAPPPPATGTWSFVSFPVQSPHPYANDFAGRVDVEAPENATEIKLHFARVDVEAGYDFVVVKDTAGNKLAEWTGEKSAFESGAFPQRKVSLFLFTDSSVTGWGLELDGYSWR
jgi:subtilisin family serine protease